jgi:hypothetical protein
MAALEDIVLIVIRILILNWGVWVFATLLASVLESLHSKPSLLTFLPSGILLVLAILIWIAGPKIAKVVTPKKEYSINLGGLSRRDLYAFAFVFLGVYFVLTSVSSVLVSIWNLLWSSGLPGTHVAVDHFTPIARESVRLIVSIFLLVFADRWSRLLLSREAAQAKSEAIQ